MTSTSDAFNSSYREVLIEHLFIGEIMRRLWLRGITRFEVLQPQVDDSGYDLAVEANDVLRHIQLKSSFNRATTRQVKASLNLAQKPSACIVWILFNPQTLELGPFLWFGNDPGEPIPDLTGFKIAKHTRANAQGKKKERPNQRFVPRSRFQKVADLDALVKRLFGNL
jgi:hypothetical protein